MKEDAEFYVGQKAFIKKGDDILVLCSHEGTDYPGGRIQEGENDLVESLKREVREETGLEICVGAPFVTWANTFPPQHRLAGKKVYLVGYKCDYVSGDVQLTDDHDKYQWVNKDNYKDVNYGTSYFDILKEYFK